MPVYDYTTAIRESVWVTTPLDNDGDGAPDKIVVDLVRARETKQAGVKIPVIMDASPYYTCRGRGNESERNVYGPDGNVVKFPLFYDNYFVPRGYAFAAVDFNGTNRSTGCGDVGGREEIIGAKTVIDWLNGRAHGEYADGTVARADWTTGKVGMIGKSWDGTVANGVAATGVEGLATIVPISAISSWYDYYRNKGAIYTADFGPSWLSGFVNGRPDPVCVANRERLLTGSENATVVITLSDNGFTIPFHTGATVDVDLGRSRLWLPVSLLPGATALPDTTTAPQIVTELQPAEPTATPTDRWTTFR